MDPASIFLGGLGGAVIGSVLSLFGAYKLDVRRNKEAQRGAARALYFEVISNAVYLESMALAENVPLRHVSDTTWRDTQTQVAGLLTPSQLKIVARAYFNAEIGHANVEHVIASSASTDEVRRMWANDSHDFDAAAAVLRCVAWSEKEREELAR